MSDKYIRNRDRFDGFKGLPGPESPLRWQEEVKAVSLPAGVASLSGDTINCRWVPADFIPDGTWLVDWSVISQQMNNGAQVRVAILELSEPENTLTVNGRTRVHMYELDRAGMTIVRGPAQFWLAQSPLNLFNSLGALGVITAGVAFTCYRLDDERVTAYVAPGVPIETTERQVVVNTAVAASDTREILPNSVFATNATLTNPFFVVWNPTRFTVWTAEWTGGVAGDNATIARPGLLGGSNPLGTISHGGAQILTWPFPPIPRWLLPTMNVTNNSAANELTNLVTIWERPNGSSA